MTAVLLAAAWSVVLPQKLTLVALLIGGGWLLGQFNRWERQLLQGEGQPPRNNLS